MAKFEDIKIGDVAELEHVVTSTDLERFVELTGDDNRLHTDPEYAARTSFKKPVAHGMLGASFISTVIGTKLPGDGALWFSQSLEFILPVRVGDCLTVRAEVLSKTERTQTIELQTDIYNQHRQKVTTGIAKVKVVELQSPSEDDPQPIRRVALVIGGSGGIGSAICRILAADGFDVAVHYFSNETAAKTVAEDIQASGHRALVVAADIDSESAVAEMVEQVVRHFGTITVLVNCATAKIAAVGFSNLLWADFDEHVVKGIRGLFHLARCVVPVMEAARYGKIILIGTQYVDDPAPNLLPYITAKAALEGFGRALALELAPRGVRVNIVSPGMTDTVQIADVPERVRLLTAAQTPLRRLARPEDIAGAVAFLASNRADFLAGETIRVNGGQVMR